MPGWNEPKKISNLEDGCFFGRNFLGSRKMDGEGERGSWVWRWFLSQKKKLVGKLIHSWSCFFLVCGAVFFFGGQRTVQSKKKNLRIPPSQRVLKWTNGPGNHTHHPPPPNHALRTKYLGPLDPKCADGSKGGQILDGSKGGQILGWAISKGMGLKPLEKKIKKPIAATRNHLLGHEETTRNH